MAAAAGWKVASIDSLPYYGTCALRGCDPKKMLIAVTEGVDWAQSLKGKGLEAETSINWPIGAGLTANEIKGTIFAYPSYASDISSMVYPNLEARGQCAG
jgi:pyruvate/2-oxoglutarate dehydrogenase complex dihydrolipoamide dehydrogenase (E3) component